MIMAVMDLKNKGNDSIYVVLKIFRIEMAEVAEAQGN